MERNAGFSVESVICSGCGEFVNGIPNGNVCNGLPPGWYSVHIAKYKKYGRTGYTEPYKHIATRYYCSGACLPDEYLDAAEKALDK